MVLALGEAEGVDHLDQVAVKLAPLHLPGYVKAVPEHVGDGDVAQQGLFIVWMINRRD